MVLDAAIIVQENIIRLRATGLHNHKANAKRGYSSNRCFVGIHSHQRGHFFTHFIDEWYRGTVVCQSSLALSVAVGSSMIAAITILPVASRYWLKEK